MPNPPLIDPEAIENLRSLNPDDNDEFLKELVDIFLSDTPARIVDLKQSLEASDATRFCRAAHSIKGSASNLGAEDLRGIAAELEHHSKEGRLGGLEVTLTKLEASFARTQAHLLTIVRK